MELGEAVRYATFLEKERPYAREILEVYQKILKFQMTSMEEVQEIPAPLRFDPSRPELFKLLREEELRKTTGNFLEFLLSYGTPQMKKFAGEAKEKLLSENKLKQVFLTVGVLGKKTKSSLPWEFLNFVALSVLPVLLNPLVKKLEKNLPEELESIRCPFCGALPLAAYLKASEEGKRFLVCPVCYGEWPIRRDRCVGCGKENLEESYYFIPEGENGFLRIEICNSCKTYLKSLDERKGEKIGRPPFPLIEDVATPHIDLKMDEEGFKKVRKNLFGF